MRTRQQKLEDLIRHPNTPNAERAAAQAALSNMKHQSADGGSYGQTRPAYKPVVPPQRPAPAAAPPSPTVHQQTRMAGEAARQDIRDNIRKRGISYEGLVSRRYEAVQGPSASATPPYSGGCMVTLTLFIITLLLWI
jgi:hypothetical protein